MNRRLEQKFLISPDFKKIEVANDMNGFQPQSHSPDTAEYIQFQQFLRAEKRQSFWGGITVAAMALFTIFMLVMIFNASGMSFMTCQEFGETFTCRLGGL